MFFGVAKGVPQLPFVAIAQTADAVAFFIHFTDTDTGAVNVE